MPQEIKNKFAGALHSRMVWMAVLGFAYTTLDTHKTGILAAIPPAIKPLGESLYFLLMIYFRAVTTQSLEEKGKNVDVKSWMRKATSLLGWSIDEHSQTQRTIMLVPKPIDELLVNIRDTLQDKQKSRWDDQELYRYLDQGLRDIALQTKYLHLLYNIDVVEGITTYTLPSEAIEFYKISSVQPYEITDPTQIEFPLSKAERVVVDYYYYPAQILYGVTTHLTLESDLFDALVFFVLMKAYLKEDTPENFQKSQVFNNEYRKALSRGGRWNGQFDVQPHKTDFHI